MTAAVAVAIEKARRPAILENALRYETRIYQALLDCFDAVSSQITTKELGAKLETGDLTGAMAYLDIEHRLEQVALGAGIPAQRFSVQEALRDTFEAGAKVALGELDHIRVEKAVSLKLSTRMSLDLSNPMAIQFIRNYTFHLIRQISQALRLDIQKLILRAFTKGMHPYETAREIKKIVGLTASQIQAVENFRDALAAKPTLDLLNRALRDKRFDPTLLKAIQQGQQLRKEQIQKMVDRYRERMVQYRARTIARTECLPGETLVDGAVVRAVFRRWYVGDMVEICTRGGRKISATPNHPMFTARGWLPAGKITKGDYLVCHSGNQYSSSPGNGNEQKGPSTIREVFDFLNVVRISERDRCTDIDFHGDGMDGQVDILSPNRELRIGRFSPLNEPSLKDLLTPTDFARSSFCRFCGGLLPINQSLHLCPMAQGDSTFVQQALYRVSVNSEDFCNLTCRNSRSVEFYNLASMLFEPEIIPTSTATLVEELPSIREASNNSCGRDYIANPSRVCSDCGSYLYCAHSGEIELDGILSIRIRSWSGHVYNLSTPHGYFTISGAYTGNSLRASNSGQEELWRQAKEQKLLRPEITRRVWLNTPDERTCTRPGGGCEAIPDRNPDGVRLDEDFDTGFGPIHHPPAHPQCRCCLGLKFLRGNQ